MKIGDHYIDWNPAMHRWVPVAAGTHEQILASQLDALKANAFMRTLNSSDEADQHRKTVSHLGGELVGLRSYLKRHVGLKPGERRKR
jgi:hypothetical protein